MQFSGIWYTHNVVPSSLSSSKKLYHPQRSPYAFKRGAMSIYHQCLITTNMFTFSVDLPPLDISYKWNCRTCRLCVWLLSLSIIFSRFKHVINILFLFVPNNIPLHGYTTFFLIHLLVEGHLSCFHLMAVKNNAAVNIYV